MSRLIVGVSAVALLLWLPNLAEAQYRGPTMGANPSANVYNKAIYDRPTVSPYLNLLRPQGGVGIPNYQSLVRPEMQQRRTNQLQERQISQLQNKVYQGPSSTTNNGSPQEIRTTGHVTRFMNHSSFYPALGGDGGSVQRPKPRAPGGGR
jgi:hypothetical protein